MPAIDTGPDEDCRLERLSNWVFWSLWSLIILISAAFYYEKAADHRSAFVRWRPQVLQFWAGVNIYDKMIFPNPPIMPITLYPLMTLPTVTGAMCWFAIKVVLTTAALVMLLQIVRPPGQVWPPMFRSLVLLLSLRPILGDLHHGNNNLLILFLVVAMFYAWRRGYDIGAGLLLALATSYKVTPALFFVYFAYKRSWRTFGAGLLGLGIFLLIVPSAVIGPEFNGECLGMWWHRMVAPFVVQGADQLAGNQPVPGRSSEPIAHDRVAGPRPLRHSPRPAHHVFAALDGQLRDQGRCALPPGTTGVPLQNQNNGPHRSAPAGRGRAGRAHDAFRVGAKLEAPLRDCLAAIHVPGRGILFVACWPEISNAACGLVGRFFVLMAATSTEIGGIFADGQGHEIAQGYGSFLWAGVVLYAAVAWRVWARRSEVPVAGTPDSPGLSVPRSHLISTASPRSVVTS